MTNDDSKEKYTNNFLGLKHLLEPNFTRPRLQISLEAEKKLLRHLTKLYSEEKAKPIFEELKRVMIVHNAYMTSELSEAEKNVDITQRFTERDIILSTYGDLIISKDKTPLQTLAHFTQRLFRGLITCLHILPFHPFSSDRGFSVINYEVVDPRLGKWEDLIEISNSFKLMFDGVINHCSTKSKWFRRFISGDPDYENYFISFDSSDGIDQEQLSKILRPRTSSLLSHVETINGPKYVWTTFSEDQVDLNFKNPRVLLKIVRVLLDYIRRGADIIRLDAITYLWREIGTSCAHLEQTHEVVKLFRSILDVVAPHVALITETNVPHKDNITYFGNGHDEAQMVYNFALPPLVLHTFLTSDSTKISAWAKELIPPSETTVFFNFLDSHDGIGIMAAKGILSDDEINFLCETISARGGFVSMRSASDGSETPYELNTTWFSALNPGNSQEPIKLQTKKFIASRAIALCLRGVPGIYLLSMFASRNDLEAVSRDGVKRSINRSTLYEEKVLEIFMDRSSIERRIADAFMDMLEIRVNEQAFHPNGSQEILDFGPSVFALKRNSPDKDSEVICIINITNQPLKINLFEKGITGKLTNLLTELSCYYDTNPLEMNPYDIAWLKKE